MKAWPVVAILVVQSLICLAHWFLYRTFVDFWWPVSPLTTNVLRIALSVLSVIFIVATILSFRFSNPAIKAFYWFAAVWLGLSNFFLVGACVAWLTDLILRFALSNGAHLSARPYVASILLFAAVAATVYGILNARHIRQRRISVRLANLPNSWRGRTALLLTDLHLGNINGARFARRIAGMARRLDPSIIFLAGDLYDGSHLDPDSQAAPIFQLSPPLGTWFVGGNHEEFGGAEHYEKALTRAGVHVLHNERVVIEGLHLIGVPYHSTYPLQLRAFLESLQIKGGPASVLLNHVPNRLPVAERAGVSLQLSGHTHGGQFFPFSWITRRAFGRFTYGLQRFGEMQVYTSSGAGTWGPPMRVGTHPEIVLLTFE